MTIKIKLRGNNKATVRYNNPAEEAFFIQMIKAVRDDNTRPHPKISIKTIKGEEIPPNPRPMQIPKKPDGMISGPKVEGTPVVIKPPEVKK